jgi:hypothetical protein
MTLRSRTIAIEADGTPVRSSVSRTDVSTLARSGPPIAASAMAA